MSNSKSDKPLALKTIFGCLMAIAISYTLLAVFSHQIGGNFKNAVYSVVVILSGMLFVVLSIIAYKQADDTVNDNKSRLYVIALTVFIIIWAGAWVAGSNERVAPGSPQMEDVR